MLEYLDIYLRTQNPAQKKKSSQKLALKTSRADVTIHLSPA